MLDIKIINNIYLILKNNGLCSLEYIQYDILPIDKKMIDGLSPLPKIINQDLKFKDFVIKSITNIKEIEGWLNRYTPFLYTNSLSINNDLYIFIKKNGLYKYWNTDIYENTHYINLYKGHVAKKFNDK